MKLNISYPATGCQKLIEVDDDRKLRIFYDKRMSSEVAVESLGDEWKGYVVRISGGNDKQGFPMKQGVLTATRVRLLLGKGHSCFRPRRSGERRRKSVRGCIVDSNLSVLSLVVIKKGENEIPGLTDTTIPRRLGPKRASKIRKLFNLTKQDDVRQYVVRRPLPAKEGKKERTKAPKIQRLITPLTLQRKRHKLLLKKKRAAKKRDEAADYAKLLAQRLKEAKERKMERRRSASQSKSSISRDSTSQSAAKPAAPKAAKPKVAKPAKAAAKPAAKSTGKPAAKPAGAKPAAKPAAGKPAAKPAAGKPAAKAGKPAAKAAGKPAGKPAAGKPAAKAGKPAAKAGKPAGKPAAGKPAKPAKK